MYKFNQNGKDIFEIFETATEQIILSGGKEVREIYRGLKNNANGFRGWTPAFFVASIKKGK